MQLNRLIRSASEGEHAPYQCCKHVAAKQDKRNERCLHKMAAAGALGNEHSQAADCRKQRFNVPIELAYAVLQGLGTAALLPMLPRALQRPQPAWSFAFP